jgi:hypothetical protein
MLGLKIRLLTLTRRWMHLFINEFESITLTTEEFLMQIFMIVTKHRKQDTSGGHKMYQFEIVKEIITEWLAEYAQSY